MDTRRFKRSQYAVVVVLAPLNGTFDRKSLIVPFSPEALKLGRQLSSRTVASPDNGYFDSRVLSRQHAEVWADHSDGKVYLRDCRSSNGTYVNGRRLSAENTESEPCELQRGDEIDLGIDIMSNDDIKQMFYRISAKVEKISLLALQNQRDPLRDGDREAEQSRSQHTKDDPSNSDASDGANSTNSDVPRSSSSRTLSAASSPASQSFFSTPFPTASSSTTPSAPQQSTPSAPRLQIPNSPAQPQRRPSLETLKGVSSSYEGRSEAVFGRNASLESLALNYAASTSGGMLVKDSVKNHVAFELAAKRLVAQIRDVRADTAKLESLRSLLSEIKQAALDTERRDAQDREAVARERQSIERQQAEQEQKRHSATKKSSSMAALKAENARFRTEIAALHKHRRVPSDNKGDKLGDKLNDKEGEKSVDKKEKPASPSDKLYASKDRQNAPSRAQSRHDAFLLIGTTLLVTFVGVIIMFFFNPPVAPNGRPPFLDFFVQS